MPEHEHHHEHPPRREAAPTKTPVPLTPDDSGSRALSEALRSSFLIVKFVMIGLVILFFASGFFTVGSQERAVILRFGKPVGEGEKALRGPGAHWAWPFPIDEVVKIPFAQVQVASSTVGWYQTTREHELAGTQPPAGPTLNPAMDGYVLTADANILHVRAQLRYGVTDPLQYIFAFSDAPNFVTNALNNALFYAAARFPVDDALTRNVTAFTEAIARRVNELSTQQRLGITVEQVALTSVIPPRQLTEQFRAVLDASVRRDRTLNEARTYANEVVSRAKGEAAARQALAEGDRKRLVEAVAAEAKRFQDVLPQYRENPDLFTRLRQAEIVQRVLTNAQERIFLPSRADGKSRTLRLDLGREAPKPRLASPPPVTGDHH